WPCSSRRGPQPRSTGRPPRWEASRRRDENRGNNTRAWHRGAGLHAPVDPGSERLALGVPGAARGPRLLPRGLEPGLFGSVGALSGVAAGIPAAGRRARRHLGRRDLVASCFCERPESPLPTACRFRAEGRSLTQVPGLPLLRRDERAGAVCHRLRRDRPLELRVAGRGQPRRRRDPSGARGAAKRRCPMTRTEWSPELALPISEERDHIDGLPDALVTLVEYGDYECPYCGAAYPIVKEVQARMGDELRFVFRNFPITTSHPHAEHAAEAAEAAAAQGRFWEMHDYLYEHQRGLTDQDLHQYAEELGLDVDRFDSELAEHVHGPRVREDFMSGVRSGVNGTPTFYINGRRHDDSYDAQTLTAA